MVITYSVDIIMALVEGEEPTPEWWQQRCARAALRSGGLPAECADLPAADLLWETDPESQEQFVRACLPLPPETSLGRAKELCHMLSSTLDSEGYTLRQGDRLVEALPGELPEAPRIGTFGEERYTQARVCAQGCMSCVLAGGGGVGCCSEGGAFSMADIGSLLLADREDLVEQILALPGRVDASKWEPYLVQGRCFYHDRSKGCCLPHDLMPLQCRIYLCLPERLLPPELLAEYESYVERLEETEELISDHMRRVSGVDFGSSLADLKAAAALAFSALGAMR